MRCGVSKSPERLRNTSAPRRACRRDACQLRYIHPLLRCFRSYFCWGAGVPLRLTRGFLSRAHRAAACEAFRPLLVRRPWTLQRCPYVRAQHVQRTVQQRAYRACIQRGHDRSIHVWSCKRVGGGRNASEDDAGSAGAVGWCRVRLRCVCGSCGSRGASKQARVRMSLHSGEHTCGTCTWVIERACAQPRTRAYVHSPRAREPHVAHTCTPKPDTGSGSPHPLAHPASSSLSLSRPPVTSRLPAPASALQRPHSPSCHVHGTSAG